MQGRLDLKTQCHLKNVSVIILNKRNLSLFFVYLQDLLSFELLDINIVQELEKVPNNTPVGESKVLKTAN